MGGRGSGGHNRISKEEHERRNTYRKDRHEAPVPARPLPRAMADWTLATIAGIDRWNMKPICPVRDPPGLMTPAEIARVHRGLDPIAKLIVCRLLNEFWNWPAEDRAPLRAFARVGARLLLSERAATPSAQRRIQHARARVKVLAERLWLSDHDVAGALAPPW